MSRPEPLYILGAGMHPWGKWGRDFTEYGVVAARAALAEAGLEWRQIQLVAGADTIRNGYPGFIAGSTFAQKLGWNGVPVSSISMPTFKSAASVPSTTFPSTISPSSASSTAAIANGSKGSGEG